MQQLSLSIETDTFAASTEARVDGEGTLLSQRGGQEQLPKVLGKDLYGLTVSTFLKQVIVLRLNRRADEPLVAVPDGGRHLLRRLIVAANELALKRFQNRFVILRRNLNTQQTLGLAPEHCQNAMRRRTHSILLPVKPRLELAGLFLFGFHHFRREHSTAAEDVAHAVAGRDVFADTLGNNVACPGKGIVHILNTFSLVDERHSQLLDAALILFLQSIGQRLQSAFDSHRSAGLAFWLIWQIEVLQVGHRRGLLYACTQFGCQLALLLYALQDSSATLIYLFEFQKQIAYCRNLYLVKVARGLLAITGDERHRGTGFKQLNGLLNLAHTEVQL